MPPAASQMKQPSAKRANCRPKKLAGAAGFEPANAGTKNRCLTTWRRPIEGEPGLIAGQREVKTPQRPLLAIGDPPVDRVVIILGQLPRQVADREVPRPRRLDERH